VIIGFKAWRIPPLTKDTDFETRRKANTLAIREASKVVLDVLRNIVLIGVLLYASKISHSKVLYWVAGIGIFALSLYCVSFFKIPGHKPGYGLWQWLLLFALGSICGILFYALVRIPVDLIVAAQQMR
jgi:hypothetical protein